MSSRGVRFWPSSRGQGDLQNKYGSRANRQYGACRDADPYALAAPGACWHGQSTPLVSGSQRVPLINARGFSPLPAPGRRAFPLSHSRARPVRAAVARNTGECRQRCLAPLAPQLFFRDERGGSRGSCGERRRTHLQRNIIRRGRLSPRPTLTSSARPACYGIRGQD